MGTKFSDLTDEQLDALDRELEERRAKIQRPISGVTVKPWAPKISKRDLERDLAQAKKSGRVRFINRVQRRVDRVHYAETVEVATKSAERRRET